MKYNLSTQELVNRNRKIVGFVFFFIAFIFITTGSILGKSSYVSGGIVTILVGFFGLIMPTLMRKK